MKSDTLTYLDTLPKWETYRFLGSKGSEPNPVKWSGIGAPPAIGSTVRVRINAIGDAVVLSYYVQHGFLGLYVRMKKPPGWMLAQNKSDCCHVFGSELEED